ncbi:hypothetical protein KAR91_78575 [Candidatus Pacearchaeota archaeon]|nr:hypothetical protein [Candidatus Pacearchaeota archaeon]
MSLSPFFHFSRFRGINNVDDPVRLFDIDQMEAAGSTSLAAATDVYVDDTRMMVQREGYDQRATGNIHSMWSNGEICLFVEGSDLKRLESDLTTKTIIKAGFGSAAASFVDINGVIVVSNYNKKGLISDGVYSEFLTSFQLEDLINKEPMPPGHLVETYKGRLLIARGQIVNYSDVTKIKQYDPSKNYIPLLGIITMMKAVSNGVYISDGQKTYFANGLDLKTATLETIADYPALAGTAQLISKGVKKDNIIWMSPEGICMGGPGGAFENITEDRYLPGEPDAFGPALFRSDLNQYITSLNN